MYWVDKYWLLRFNQTPVNINEKPIQHALQMLYWVFYMHFFVGYSMITNDSIIKSDEEFEGMKLSELSDSSNINIFDAARYNSYHAQVFFCLGMILMVAAKVVVGSAVFHEALNTFLENKFAIGKTVENGDTISNDYYELMNIKFLANEYNRTLNYKDKLQTMNEDEQCVQ